MKVDIFAKLGSLVSIAKERDNARYAKFLDLYEQIVCAIPGDAAKEFGSISVDALDGGKTRENWGLELTVTDFAWWKKHIETVGTRFVDGPDRVELAILHQLSTKAEAFSLSVDERRELMKIIKAQS